MQSETKPPRYKNEFFDRYLKEKLPKGDDIKLYFHIELLFMKVNSL